jgi:hypothetical protein
VSDITVIYSYLVDTVAPGRGVSKPFALFTAGISAASFLVAEFPGRAGGIVS